MDVTSIYENPDSLVIDELSSIVHQIGARYVLILSVGRLEYEILFEAGDFPPSDTLDAVSSATVETLRQLHTTDDDASELFLSDEHHGFVETYELASSIDFTQHLVLVFDSPPTSKLLESLSLCNLQVLISYKNTERLNNEFDLLTQSIGALLKKEESVNPYQVTLQLLLKLFHYPVGSIWELHDNHPRKAASYLTLESTFPQSLNDYPRHCLKEGKGLVWRALAEGSDKLQIVQDFRVSEFENKELFPQYKDKLVALVRIGVAEEVYGVACIAGAVPMPVRSIQRIFRSFEQLAALEIHTQRQAKRNKLLERVSEIVPTVSDSMDAACEVIARNVRELLLAEGCSLFLKRNLDTREETIRLYGSDAHPGFSPSSDYEDFKRGGSRPEYRVGRGSITGYIASSGRPQICNEVSKHRDNSKRFREIADANNDSWVGIPICSDAGGGIIGVLRCSGKLRVIEGQYRPFVFDDFDVRILEYIASLITPILQTIQNTQQLNSLNKRLRLAEKIREHELKAPLASIAAQASFVKKYLNDPGAKSKEKRLDDIIFDTTLSAFLLKDPHVPNRKEFEKWSEYISPRVLINEVQRYLTRIIGGRSSIEWRNLVGGAELEGEIQHFMNILVLGSAPHTVMNRYLMQRALYNLGTNAIKYGKNGGVLTISLGEDSRRGRVVIDFKDDGVGIDEDDITYVFDEGFRGDSVKERASGEGLGLSVTKEIVEVHGGMIVLKNNRNPTWFQIRLPIKKDARRRGAVLPGVLRMDSP